MTFLTITFVLMLAHSWYPAECCDESHCHLIARELVTRTSVGWTIAGRSYLIVLGSEKLSPDGEFHLCENKSTHQFICLFVPDVQG